MVAFLRRARSVLHGSDTAAGERERRQAVLTAWEQRVLDEARPFTMTSNERVLATMDAISYVAARGIPGAIVECGVWRGGSVLAMLRVLQQNGVTNRDVYLFDTFEGMTEPGEMDTSRFEAPALDTWSSQVRQGKVAWDWAFDPEIFNLDAVRDLLLATGYPERHLHFVRGKVEETLPAEAPDSIAVLRLDTDWYSSTWHELVTLYPRVSEGGVLIIDDYGHWDGCRAAVDEYFATVEKPILLSRIDYTGRTGIKA